MRVVGVKEEEVEVDGGCVEVVSVDIVGVLLEYELFEGPGVATY
jgi:hypothetical protein